MKKIYFILIFLVFLHCTQTYAADKTYVDQKYNFSIEYPENCRVIKNFQGASTAIFLPSKSFFNFFNGYISVTAKSTKPANRPTEELIDIYFKYDKTVSKKEKIKINDIDFLSVVQTKRKFFLDFKLYILITVKETKVYIIVYANTVNNFDKHLSEAKKITHSFRFTE